MVSAIFLVIFGIYLLIWLIKLFIRLSKKKENSHTSHSIDNDRTKKRANESQISEEQYYINVDNLKCGPLTLFELKHEYGELITEDTLITTNTLNGEWYEAKYFECLEELFNKNRNFGINEFGEIVRY